MFATKGKRKMRQRSIRLTAILGLAVLIAAFAIACGGSAPTAMGPPVPTVTAGLATDTAAPVTPTTEPATGQATATRAQSKDIAATATTEAARVTASPAAPEESQPPAGSEAEHIVTVAIADLAMRTDLPEEEILLRSVEAVEWPDAGLGCPLPGMAYAQVITPGYRILLEAEGKTYKYHTDMVRAVILCGDDGLPDLPAIPVNPDEILDGKPWMPSLGE